MNSVRIASVERLVAGDQALDVHRLRLGGRPVGGDPLDCEVRSTKFRRRHERGPQHGFRAPRHVQHVAGLIRDDANPALADRPVRVDRRPVDALGECREPAAGSRAANSEIASSVGRQLEEASDARRPQIPACRAERQVEMSREGGTHLRRGNL